MNINRVAANIFWQGIFPSIMAFFFFLKPVLGADNLSTYREVEAAYQAGQIDRSEKLVKQMSLFFEPERLSAGIEGRIEFLKSGSEMVREVIDNWDMFSADQKSLLSGLISRPPADSVYDSPSSYFRIHYSLSGPDYVPSEDKDLNFVPDYVERVAAYCDSSWNLFINSLGYYPPPDDNGQGGDDRYDIYLLALGGYGVTFPEAPGDSLWEDYSSYIGIHRNFYGFPPNDDPEGDTIGAQKVTCAHEFYHAVQLAYDASEDLWLMEATATWMEEVVFPEVNDNYNYLYLFFDVPEVSLYNISDYHQYGAFVWPAFLQQKFGDTIFLKVWEACRYNNSLDALDSMLADFGASVEAVMPEFTRWNYMTNSRAVPGMFYEDAADYPEIRIDRFFNNLPHNSVMPLVRPDGLAANYIQYLVGDVNGILEVWFKGVGQITISCAAVLKGNAKDTTIIESANPGSEISFYVPNVEDYDKLAIIPTVLTPGTADNLYYVSTIIHLHGDANGDGAVNIGDASYLTNFVFHNGADPVPIRESGDTNCDGSVNVADVVFLTKLIFHDGPEPCSSK